MNDIGEIESYVNNKMNDEARMLFENRLKNNKSLAEDVRVYKAVIVTLEEKTKSEKEYQALKTTLANIQKKYESEKVMGFHNTRKKKIILIGAMAALLMLGFFFFRPNSKVEMLVAEHKSLNVEVKGAMYNDLKKGARLFNQAKYVEALPILKTYVAKHPEDVEVYLSLGVSYLETGEWEKALGVFMDENLHSSVFHADAQWYQALTLWKLNETEACKSVLRDIDTSKDVELNRKVTTLLKALD